MLLSGRDCPTDTQSKLSANVPTQSGKSGNRQELRKLVAVCSRQEPKQEADMPILILWAIPAIVVLGGGTYLLFLR